MLPSGLGPAAELARRGHDRLIRRDGQRPYPQLPETATSAEVALAATRALVHAQDRVEVREVVVTVVRDLGGALVPARFEPAATLEIDLSLGLGEPLLVVADPLSVAALHLREILPGLLEDAYAILRHLPDESLPRLDPEELVPAEALPRYLGLLGRADGPGARALVGGLLADGVAAEHLVEHLLAPAQREVGERWYRGEWSIADEHAATAITERCLATLLSPGVEAQELPLVVLASPEGEWHGLPGRLAAAAAAGTRTRALRPGLPLGQLRQRLVEERPAALALSCTMATSLLPALALVTLAHELEIPVVAGGRAFGPRGSRANRLGADGWAGSARELAALLPGLHAGPVPVPLPREALLADALPLPLLRRVWAQQAEVRWVARMNEVQSRSALDELRWISRHAAAAYVVGDETVLDEPLRWLVARLRHRDAPEDLLPNAATDLAEAMAVETPVVASLVAAAADRLRAAPPAAEPPS